MKFSRIPEINKNMYKVYIKLSKSCFSNFLEGEETTIVVPDGGFGIRNSILLNFLFGETAY